MNDKNYMEGKTNVNMKKLFQRFRKDMLMDKNEWFKFCRRYNERETSTIVWYIKNLYGIEVRASQVQEYLASELMWCD